jgi:hypothetical protein
MTALLTMLVALSLLGTIATGIATGLAAKRFFGRLVVAHPELANAFPEPMPGTRYGPIRPAYMQYLKARRHLTLPEPELQRAGAKVLRLLYAHAVLLTLTIVLALCWGAQGKP